MTWLKMSIFMARESRSRGRSGVADRQHFPLMAIRLVPVDVSVLGVDLHVHGAAHRAPVRDAGSFDPPEDRVELLRRNAKAEMIDRKVLVRVYEVERQALVDVDRREGAGPR